VSARGFFDFFYNFFIIFFYNFLKKKLKLSRVNLTMNICCWSIIEEL